MTVVRSVTESPLTRAVDAHRKLTQLRVDSAIVEQIRKVAVCEAVAGGLSQGEVARELGVSRVVVTRLCN